jgi:hypothetical protein
VDRGTLLQKSYAGRLDNLIYEANALEASLHRSPNALNWPLVQMAEELKASATALQQQLLTTGTKVIALHTTAKDATLAGVANAIGAPVNDVISLNVGLVPLGIVPQGTVVRYHTPRSR